MSGKGYLFENDENKKRIYKPLETQPLSDDQLNMLKYIKCWGNQAGIVFGLLRTIDDLKAQLKNKRIIN